MLICSYFKKSILHHLEASGLIRLIEYQRPITDQAGRDEAIRKARVYTIRRETTAKKTARKAGLPYRPDTVEAVEPVFFSKHYAWVLGDSSEPDLRSTPIPAPKNADLAWSAAEELERRRLLAEEEEAERIAERKERRKLKYKQEGEAYKAERQRLIDAGLWEQFLATKAKEAQREEAIDTVRQYAEQTGEDVSAWFQELGVRVRPSFFGGDRMQSSEEQEDLAAEMYKQEQAALVEAERERERNGGKTVARPAQAHDQDHDDPSSFGLKSPRKPDYPVDWAWQEQLKAKLAPGSDSPFILKSASTPPSASRLRATPEPAEPVNRMSDEQRARGQEQLQWSRTAPVSRSGRGKGFGLR
jgi:hypothetical protein